MLTVDIALSFFGIAVLLALAPGPDNIFVLMQSAISGRASGLYVVMGLCIGLIGHTAAVAAGLAAIVAASETAFMVIKLAGAAYLLYLAWGAFRAPAGPLHSDQPVIRLSPGQLVRRGIFMNLSNPKVSLFFLALLPQFTDPSRGSVAAQTVSLGALFMLATFVVFGAIAWFAGLLGERMQRSPHAGMILNRLAGTVFAGLAVKLALAER